MMYTFCQILPLFLIFSFGLLLADSGYPAFPAIPYLTIPQMYVGRRLNFPNPPIYAATVSLEAVSKFNDYRMAYLYAPGQPAAEGDTTASPGTRCFITADTEAAGTCIPRTELDKCANGIAQPAAPCMPTTEVCCVTDPDPVDQTRKGDSKRKRQFKDTDVGIMNHGIHPKFLKDKSR